MASRIDNLAAGEYERAYRESYERVVRRVKGSSSDKQKIDNAIFEHNAVTAGTDGGRGGLAERDGVLEVEAGGLLELPANQNVHHDDVWEIRGELWKTLGDALGKDGGSQTFRVIRHDRYRGRQPQLNRTER